ncbi:MAG TPA: hypothetical protein PLR99_33540, partial [Polyangiaceae bacterium]|nr:hypothetical protein [Polyangiaceae bacterium]
MTTRSLPTLGLAALVTALLACSAGADDDGTTSLEEATTGGAGGAGRASPGEAAPSCRIDPKLALQPFTPRDVSLGAFRVSLGAGSSLSV